MRARRGQGVCNQRHQQEPTSESDYVQQTISQMTMKVDKTRKRMEIKETRQRESGREREREREREEPGSTRAPERKFVQTVRKSWQTKREREEEEAGEEEKDWERIALGGIM
jgi:hypothetical protein